MRTTTTWVRTTRDAPSTGLGRRFPVRGRLWVSKIGPVAVHRLSDHRQPPAPSRSCCCEIPSAHVVSCRSASVVSGSPWPRSAASEHCNCTQARQEKRIGLGFWYRGNRVEIGRVLSECPRQGIPGEDESIVV